MQNLCVIYVYTSLNLMQQAVVFFWLCLCSLIRTNIQCLCLTAECTQWSDPPLFPPISQIFL